MTLNASGPISLAGTTAGQSIELENGGDGTTQISLNDAAVRLLAGVPSGAITMPTDFYGKSNSFTTSFSGGTNVDLATIATSLGWNGSSTLLITNNGTITSASTGSPALSITGTFPGGVVFTNNALIVGRGGDGGSGGSSSASGAGHSDSGSAGGGGGPALFVSSAVTIYNYSTIAGGGGGGGGGNGQGIGNKFPHSEGGGGGGGGIGNSSGGGGGSGQNASGSSGGGGTTTSAGGGGAGGVAGAFAGGAGGSGGSYGASGSSGDAANSFFTTTPASGGAGGSCTSGNSNITWAVTGNRYGALN